MRRLPDLRLMLITGPATAAGRGVAETVRMGTEGGVTCVQLRDKEMSDESMAALGRILMAALAPRGIPLFVNDRVGVAAAIGAHLHIGQDDGDPAAARAAIGPDAILGLSVTRAAEIGTVDPAVVDYAGVGPVFATGSKPDAAPPLGLEGLRAIAARLPVPTVAIGGIGAANAAAVIAAGAAGVAVVSAICAAPDPRAAAAALRTAVEG